MRKNVLNKLEKMKEWSLPSIPEDILHGDMPGDKVKIEEEHIRKSEVVFRQLLNILQDEASKEKDEKIVIAVCGGSGVGKSETASLLSYYLTQQGIKSYTLSGDNYPRRIPVYNDAERLRVFRNAGIEALVEQDLGEKDVWDTLLELQEKEEDANGECSKQYPWFSVYFEGGVKGLKGYLGTEAEIDFEKLSRIVREFKAGKEAIYLKRMGRSESELWYEKVDFSDTEVLMIEWTHGNSDNYEGVDIPILLNSTPEETLAHRNKRNRDGKTDSHFTKVVLECEQAMLHNQAKKAKIILSKAGELLSYDEYQKLMG